MCTTVYQIINYSLNAQFYHIEIGIVRSLGIILLTSVDLISHVFCLFAPIVCQMHSSGLNFFFFFCHMYTSYVAYIKEKITRSEFKLFLLVKPDIAFLPIAHFHSRSSIELEIEFQESWESNCISDN